MASFGSAASGAADTFKFNREMDAKHRQMNIQAAQNRFERNRARRLDERAEEEADRDYEFKVKQHEDDQAERKAKWKADLKQRDLENKRQDRLDARQEQLDEDARAQQDWSNKRQEQLDEDARAQQDWSNKRQEAIDKRNAAKDEFDLEVTRDTHKHNQELWARDNKVFEENHKKRQMQSDEVRAALASAINNAIIDGDDKNGMYVLRPDDAYSFQAMIGNVVDGADTIVGLGVQYAQEDASGNLKTLSLPNIMVYTKDANGGIIPQPMPRDKVATIVDQYPQILDGVKARNQSAYDTWGKNFGVIKEPTAPRNVAVEDYHKNRIDAIVEKIKAYSKEGTNAVPPEVYTELETAFNDYRESVGLPRKKSTPPPTGKPGTDGSGSGTSGSPDVGTQESPPTSVDSELELNKKPEEQKQ